MKSKKLLALFLCLVISVSSIMVPASAAVAPNWVGSLINSISSFISDVVNDIKDALGLNEPYSDGTYVISEVSFGRGDIPADVDVTLPDSFTYAEKLDVDNSREVDSTPRALARGALATIPTSPVPSADGYVFLGYTSSKAVTNGLGDIIYQPGQMLDETLGDITTTQQDGNFHYNCRLIPVWEEVGSSTSGTSGTISSTLKWYYNESTKTLNFVGSGDIPAYEENKTPWSSIANKIERITFNSTNGKSSNFSMGSSYGGTLIKAHDDISCYKIKGIGSYAFANMPNLKFVEISFYEIPSNMFTNDPVTIINTDYHGISDTPNTQVEIPAHYASNVFRIENDAFANDPQLEVNVGAGQLVGQTAFYKAKKVNYYPYYYQYNNKYSYYVLKEATYAPWGALSSEILELGDHVRDTIAGLYIPTTSEPAVVINNDSGSDSEITLAPSTINRQTNTTAAPSTIARRQTTTKAPETIARISTTNSTTNPDVSTTKAPSTVPSTTSSKEETVIKVLFRSDVSAKNLPASKKYYEATYLQLWQVCGKTSPTAEGYIFTGWDVYTTDNEYVMTYNDADLYNLIEIDQDLVFIAQWASDAKYSVFFASAKDGPSEENIEHYPEATIYNKATNDVLFSSLLDNKKNPSAAGYIFDGYEIRINNKYLTTVLPSDINDIWLDVTDNIDITLIWHEDPSYIEQPVRVNVSVAITETYRDSNGHRKTETKESSYSFYMEYGSKLTLNVIKAELEKQGFDTTYVTGTFWDGVNSDVSEGATLTQETNIGIAVTKNLGTK